MKRVNDYDEISPITGKKTVLVEPISDTEEYRLDMLSGYHTYTNWNKNNEAFENSINEFESNMPGYVANGKFITDNGQYWYPVLEINNFKFLYPSMTISDSDIPEWGVAKLVKIESTNNDLADLQIISLDAEGKDLYYIDTANGKVFDNFEEAFGELYAK